MANVQMELLVVCLMVASMVQSSYGQQTFFRKDYTYIEEGKAFYKIHTLRRNWYEAKKVCEREGASFFYPESKAEQDAVIQFWNKTQPLWDAYIGISDLLVKGIFQTVNGEPLWDIYAVWSPAEPNDVNGEEDCVTLHRTGTLNDLKCETTVPFICKKTLATLQWNKLCNIPDKSYEYQEVLGKCYKFHSEPMTWEEAFSFCHHEQSYLAIINSQAEADHLKSMAASAPDPKSCENPASNVIYLGFLKRNGSCWQTVKSMPLNDSGYEKWAEKQPDGQDRELCGSMSYDGLLHDTKCDEKHAFVCEHDVKKLLPSVDARSPVIV